MQTRCHTSGSFHPEVPQPLALWTFPLAGIHPHCLDKLNNRPSLHCVYVCALLCGFLLFRRVCVCASSKMSAFIQQTTTKHSCMQECVRIAACACVFACALVQLQSASLLFCVRCLRLSWLLLIKKTVGGYWAFPVHHQNTKHSPTLFYKFTRNTTSIYFLRVCICTYPIYLLTRQPQDTIH